MNEFQDLVQGQLDAYNASHLERFCSYYHPQITVMFLPSGELVSTGMNEFRSVYEKIFSKYPSQKCVLKKRSLKEDCIIDEELILGRSTDPNGLEAIAIYAFRDGLIDRVWLI